jgi:hypothetical protein
MPRKPSTRRRGAQPGNQNRLSHGIYARHISIEANDDIRGMPEDRNQDELALARARLVACLDKQLHAPGEDWLFYEKTIAQYLLTISKFIHSNAVLGKDLKQSFVTVLEMVRQLNEREHVS